MTLDEFLSSSETTEAAFARRIGVAQQAVNRYRRGRIPERAIMRRIVEATGGAVQPNDFYGIEGAGADLERREAAARETGA